MAFTVKKNFLLNSWEILGILMLMWLSTISVEAFPLAGGGSRRVKCNLIQYIACYYIWQTCPLQCPTFCLMDCATCKPVCSCNYPGAVCQDPRFVGGDGITFYFHGKRNQDFCLVSDANLHINAHFIGKRNAKMKRDFTWVQSIGILFGNHQLLVGAKKTSKWEENVDHLEFSFDGKSISIPHKQGAIWQSTKGQHVMVTRTSNTNGVTVEVPGNFKVTAVVIPISAEESRVHGYDITDEDCFAHLELNFKFYKLTGNVDGVLGQTYRSNYVSKVKMGVTMPVMGGHLKYLSSHLFASDCTVSQFHGNSMLGVGSNELATEHPALTCSSGRIHGNGVVFKK
ncbi:hypothetical protein MKW94_017379 [Papaver nudicaule]|uniref:Uncharacterized protein n=1 Tax=Papaver nudicaule TaxID=74823 RepID=A0AA41SIV6_PAPNU|nr:hypothetical protein [Papaver nudicaule]